MTDKKVYAVGSPVPLGPKAQARSCAECGELAYFASESIARMRAEYPDGGFICLGCVEEEGASVLPFNAAQLATIRAAGIDFTEEQMNSSLPKMLGDLKSWYSCRRKP